MTRELDERLRAALDGTDVDALVDVGCDLADVDRQSDALACFQRAVALGEDTMWSNVANTCASSAGRWRPSTPTGRRSPPGRPTPG